MLDDIADFEAVFPRIAPKGKERDGRINLASFGELFCTPCGGVRRVDGFVSWYKPDSLVVADLQCVQCDAGVVAIWHQTGPSSARRSRLALLPRYDGGGIATINTPPAVAYYLGQAGLSRSVGANSAAVAMYRAAVESMLLEQGYDQFMLGNKIGALDKDIAANNGKPWTREINTEYLDVLKILGNASIHAGDIAKQAAFDDELLSKIAITLAGLLFVVYEAPHKKAAHLQSLRDVAVLVKK